MDNPPLLPKRWPRILCLWFVLGSLGRLFAQSYIATDLGSLGGSPYYAYASGLNDAGAVAGTSYVSAGTPRAFLYSNGTMTNLETLGGPDSRATAINAGGVVVGYSTNGLQNAFVYAGGTMTSLGHLGGYISYAYGINDAGSIVGMSLPVPGSNNHHAFSYASGTMADLGTLGGSASAAYAINAAGAIVGQSAITGDGATHAFRYSGGSMQDLGTLGGSASVAYGINSAGAVVGKASTSAGLDHAFLYSGGLMTDLGVLGGSTSTATDINDSGSIVGFGTTSSGEQHAFLYSSGMLADLNSLVSLDGGVYLTDARGINDLGQIIANGSNQHAYLLSPAAIPEPSACAMVLGIGALGLIGWHQRRSRQSGPSLPRRGIQSLLKEIGQSMTKVVHVKH